MHRHVWMSEIAGHERDNSSSRAPITRSLIPRPRFPTAADGLHHRYGFPNNSFWYRRTCACYSDSVNCHLMQQGNQLVTCMHKVHEYLLHMGTTVHNAYMRTRPAQPQLRVLLLKGWTTMPFKPFMSSSIYWKSCEQSITVH